MGCAVRLCPDAFATGKELHCRQGARCPRCRGTAVERTQVAEEQRATLAAGGWREVGGEWRHDYHGTARVEAALELAASDARNLRRAGA